MSDADSGPVTDNASDDDIVIADSGPDAGNAGDPDLALDAALNAAFDEVEKADAPKGAPEGQPTENSAGDESGDEATATETATQGVGDGAPSIHAPEHWPAERKAAFDALATPEAKTAILSMAKDLEAGVTRKSQELSEQAKFADAIRSEITDEDRQMLAAEGLDEIGGIRQVLALNRYARKDPAGYVRHVMKHLGVGADALGLSQSSKPTPPDGADQQPEPSGNHQQRPQADLPSLVNQQVTEILRQRSVQDAQTVFEAFSGEKDEAGNPRHPHVETVRGMMASLASLKQYSNLSPSAENYRLLYDAAVRAHPDTRDAVIAAEIAAKTAAEKEVMRKQADADKARRAKAPITGKGSPPGASHKGGENLDDILNDVVQQYA